MKFRSFLESQIQSTQSIVEDFLRSEIAKKHSKHDCKTVTMAFVEWAKSKEIDVIVLWLAPPHPKVVEKRPELRSKKNPEEGGDAHIMPVVNNDAVDFTARQFGVNAPFEKPLITPISQVKQVYGRIGGYFTDAPEWFMGGKTHYLGPIDGISKYLGDFSNELL